MNAQRFYYPRKLVLPSSIPNSIVRVLQASYLSMINNRYLFNIRIVFRGVYSLIACFLIYQQRYYESHNRIKLNLHSVTFGTDILIILTSHELYLKWKLKFLLRRI